LAPLWRLGTTSVRNLSTGVALAATFLGVPYQDEVRNFSDIALLWPDFLHFGRRPFLLGQKK